MTAAVSVLVGGEEFLLARAVAEVLAAAALDAGPLEVTAVEAADFTDAHLLSLASPDLFGAARALVVRGVQDLSESHREALVAYTADPLPDLVLVLVQAAGAKARGYPDQLAAAGAELVKVSAPSRPEERLLFVQDEIRAAGGQSTAAAVRALVEAVGSDLRELSATARQLVADSGGRVDEAAVARYYQGRAETTGFAVADAALAGQDALALGLLRSALDTGTAPVLLSSALASGLRDIARVRDVGGNPTAVAKALGLPSWKVTRALRAGRGWSDAGLAAAVAAVARADAGVKGAAADAGYALSRALLEIGAARGIR